MASTPAVKTTETKAKKAPVSLPDRIKSQINAAALRGKISADELSDLQAHITKVAGLLA